MTRFWRQQPSAAICLAWALIALARPADAKDKEPTRTLLTEYHQANAVAIIHCEGRTRVIYDEILKVSDALKDEVKPGPNSRTDAADRYLVFGFSMAIGDGEPEFRITRSVPLEPGSGLRDYLLKAVKLEGNKVELFRHFLGHLDSKDESIASDALLEFSKQSTRELIAIGKELPVEGLTALLRDPKTDARRCDLCGFLLGNCGTAEHADLLRRRIGELARSKNCELAGLLKGYVMLRPKEGWSYVSSLLVDETQPLQIRLDALRTAGFLHQIRPDLVEATERTKSVAAVLDQRGLEHLAIEFLRVAKAWERTDEVLALYKMSGKKNEGLRVQIIAFALQSPEPHAAAFVKELRTQTPNDVEDVERILKGAVQLMLFE